MSLLADKFALITGASRGLGRQLAHDFALAGAARLALVARSGDSLAEVRYDILKLHPSAEVLTVTADLARAEDVERVAATTLAAFDGRLDVLINNASALGPTPLPYLLDYPADELRSVLSTNLVAPFLLIQKLLPALMEQRGVILNVTSDAGVVGYPGWGAYGISKFGIEGLSQTWAAELAGSGVRVHWIDPGSMNTDMHRAAEPDEDSSEWADPAAVSGLFVALASDGTAHLAGRRWRAQDDEWPSAVSPRAESSRRALASARLEDSARGGTRG